MADHESQVIYKKMAGESHKGKDTISGDQVKGFFDGDRSRGCLTTSCPNNARHDSIGSQPHRFKLREVYRRLSLCASHLSARFKIYPSIIHTASH